MAAFHKLKAVALAAALLTVPVCAFAQAEDTPESVPDFPGRDETFGYCVGCHSMKVVGRQGMNRARWDETLAWMTDKHAMPAPDDEMRKVLLDYLEKAFPPAAPKQGGGWVSPFAPQK